MKAEALEKHVLATYGTLRIGIAVIALLFPLILGVGGFLFAGIPLQNSLSAYYHAHVPPCEVTLEAPMRNWFVGVLCAIGAFLYLYKGFSKVENIALNIAGAMAVGVAMFPMLWTCHKDSSLLSLHGFCAVSFFLCIAFVSIRCASDTLHLIQDTAVRRRFKQCYNVTGFTMIVFPLAAYLFTVVFRQLERLTLFVEIAGIMAFAAYWIIKSREILQTQSERLALQGKLEL